MRMRADFGMKTKRILYQVTAFMLCALVSSGFFAFAQKEPPAAPAKVSGTEATADPAKGSVQQKVLAFNLEGFSEKGDKKWEIQGESAESMQEDRIKLKHIVAKSFGDEAEAVLKADKGIYDKTKNNVILEDNVKVTVNNTAGMTNDYVSIPLVDGQGGAQKAKAAPEQPRDKETTTITCDGEVEFNYNSNIVHFAKNVKVASSDGMIDADKITVFLDIKSKKIREVVAEGSVKSPGART